MATSRREFLKKGTLVAIAAGVPLSLVHQVAGREAQAQRGKSLGLTKAAFGAELNSQFRINTGDRKVLVKLIEVSDLPHQNTVAPHKEGFSLIFRGSQSAVLKQDTYLIEHQKLGTFSFLIVPVMHKQSAAYYEAIVNRMYP